MHRAGLIWIVSVLFVVSLLLLLPCVSMADGTSGEYLGVKWELDSKGTLTFTSEELTVLPEQGPWNDYTDKVKTIVFGEGKKVETIRSMTLIPFWKGKVSRICR